MLQLMNDESFSTEIPVQPDSLISSPPLDLELPNQRSKVETFLRLLCWHSIKLANLHPELSKECERSRRFPSASTTRVQELKQTFKECINWASCSLSERQHRFSMSSQIKETTSSVQVLGSAYVTSVLIQSRTHYLDQCDGFYRHNSERWGDF